MNPRLLVPTWILMSLLVLAACGGETPANTTTDTISGVPDQPAATNAPAPTADRGSFSFTVTGNHEMTVNAGNFSYLRTEPVSDEGELVRSVLMNSWIGSDYPRYGITLTVLGEPEVGTHTMERFGSKYSMEYFQHESFEDTPIYYGRNLSGTLTIAQIEGNLLTGTYEFETTGSAFDEEENRIDVTVTVVGTFEDISLDDTAP